MSFFTKIKSYLPNSLTPNTVFYARASFGAVASYAAAVINPIAGAAVLLGQGAWELAGAYMESAIDRQKQRIERYNNAFAELVERAKSLGSDCSPDEIAKAKNIFFIHNLIEEVCYKAFADTIEELGIWGNKITAQESDRIIARVKEITHVELRKEGGYSKKGREMITPEQFNEVIKNITTILHDRDNRLTDARYYTLTDLCTAMDDHNSYVKNILFKSWFRCKTISSDTHLPMIKDQVDFNKRMTALVGFDFNNALEKRKKYYDTRHPNVRDIECRSTGEKTALKFVNLAAVRAKFDILLVDKLVQCDPQMALIKCLVERCSFTKDQVAELIEKSKAPCAARLGAQVDRPALLAEGITVAEFFRTYFPERMDAKKDKEHPQGRKDSVDQKNNDELAESRNLGL